MSIAGTAPPLVVPEPPSRRRRGRRETPLALALLAPSLLVFGVFVFYPLGRTFFLGLHTQSDFGNRRTYRGFDQYVDVVQSQEFLDSLWTTVRFSLYTVPTGLVLGLGLAVLANQRLRGITVFRTIFSSTVATSAAVAALMWLTLFNPSIGVINQLLAELDRPPVQFLNDPTWALPAVSATTVWQNLGITFILLIAGLQSIPEDLYESARVDGIGAWRQFWHITVPMLSPSLLVATVILSINAFSSFGQIDLLTQEGPQNSTNVLVYDVVSEFRAGDIGAASAGALVLFGIVLLLTVVQFRGLDRRVFYGS